MGLGLLSSLEPQTLQPDVARGPEVTREPCALSSASISSTWGRVNTRPTQWLAGREHPLVEEFNRVNKSRPCIGHV